MIFFKLGQYIFGCCVGQVAYNVLCYWLKFICGSKRSACTALAVMDGLSDDEIGSVPRYHGEDAPVAEDQ